MAYRLSFTKTLKTIAFFFTTICTNIYANPIVYPVDYQKETIIIDAYLNEDAWQHAKEIDDFVRYIPDQGGSAPGTTTVKMLQDDQYLYIGVIVTGVDYDLQARIAPRERINDDDQTGALLFLCTEDHLLDE